MLIMQPEVSDDRVTAINSFINPSGKTHGVAVG
jgi:hypothetical protein